MHRAVWNASIWATLLNTTPATSPPSVTLAAAEQKVFLVSIQMLVMISSKPPVLSRKLPNNVARSILVSSEPTVPITRSKLCPGWHC